jgi:hypothetical protein
MIMKAAKLKIKRKGRGRPRKEDAQRHPCGKIDQAWAQRESESEIKSVVMEARQRVHQIANSNAVHGEAGFTAGRMWIDGKITEEQLKAGNEYAEIMWRYYRSVGLPLPSARAQAFGQVRGHDGDETQDRATRARSATNRMMTVERLLLCCEAGPQVKMTTFNLFVMDHEAMRLMPPLQLQWLKRGLNALKCHFNLSKTTALG